MVGTRRKAEVEQELDSEGDAPELVTLSSGREEAQKLRKEERENQRRVQAEAKQRRQRNIVQKKKEEGSSDEQQEAPNTELLETDANPAEDEQELNFSKPARVSGLLDASIVDFLAAQEKKVVDVSISTQAEDKSQKRKRARKPKRSEAISSSSSRVKVVLLEADRPPLANCQSALAFKRNRLYGDLVHRSVSMLPKL